MNLLFPDRRSSALSIPLDMVLLVKLRTLVGNGNHLARRSNLVLGQTSRVRGDPKNGRLARDGWWQIRLGLNLFSILRRLGKVLLSEEQLAQGVVIRVDPGLEEPEDEVAPLGRCPGRKVGDGSLAIGIVVRCIVRSQALLHAGASLAGGALLKSFLFRLECPWQAKEEGIKRSGQGDVVQNGEDEEDGHEDGRSSGLGNGKQTDHADFSQVDTGKQLLEGTRIDQAVRIDASLRDEEDVVAIGEVEQAHTNS